MYFSMPPGDLRLQPLFQLLVQQLLTYLTAEDRPGPRRPVLLIFDDFRSLGALMPFVAALGHLREYKVRCLVVLQDLEQLKEVGAESVLGNCSIRIFFRANDERSAQRISRMLDTCTVTETRATISRPRYGWSGRQSVSEGLTVYGRPLLTVGELINLPPEQAIVFTGRVPAPILAEKIRYYEHDEFASRACAQKSRTLSKSC
jgi:type IV secretion system protein VirD4